MFRSNLRSFIGQQVAGSRAVDVVMQAVALRIQAGRRDDPHAVQALPAFVVVDPVVGAGVVVGGRRLADALARLLAAVDEVVAELVGVLDLTVQIDRVAEGVGAGVLLEDVVVSVLLGRYA